MADDNVAEIIRDRWEKMARRMGQEDCDPFTWLTPLVEALGQHPQVSRLFPFTSHATLCLSRTTRYPFSGDCPRADAIGEGLFRVCGADYTVVTETYEEHRWQAANYEVLGEGDVFRSVAWIASALPLGCGPAIDGDLEDLRRIEGKSVMSSATKALHTAVYNDDKVKVVALLGSGSDINATDYSGLTPLIIAVLSGRTEMVSLLLGLNADRDAHTRDNETALSLALFNGRQPEIVKLLESNPG